MYSSHPHWRYQEYENGPVTPPMMAQWPEGDFGSPWSLQESSHLSNCGYQKSLDQQSLPGMGKGRSGRSLRKKPGQRDLAKNGLRISTIFSAHDHTNPSPSSFHRNHPYHLLQQGVDTDFDAQSHTAHFFQPSTYSSPVSASHQPQSCSDPVTQEAASPPTVDRQRLREFSKAARPARRLPHHSGSQKHTQSFREHLHAASETATERFASSSSSFSFSNFPSPPHYTEITSDQPYPSTLNVSSPLTPPDVFPPVNPAIFHYRGTSFDLINPHQSLIFSTFETPGDLEGQLEDYFDTDKIMDNSNKRAPSQTHYPTLEEAYRGIRSRNFTQPSEQYHQLLDDPSPPAQRATGTQEQTPLSTGRRFRQRLSALLHLDTAPATPPPTAAPQIESVPLPSPSPPPQLPAIEHTFSQPPPRMFVYESDDELEHDRASSSSEDSGDDDLSCHQVGYPRGPTSAELDAAVAEVETLYSSSTILPALPASGGHRSQPSDWTIASSSCPSYDTQQLLGLWEASGALQPSTTMSTMEQGEAVQDNTSSIYQSDPGDWETLHDESRPNLYEGGRVGRVSSFTPTLVTPITPEAAQLRFPTPPLPPTPRPHTSSPGPSIRPRAPRPAGRPTPRQAPPIRPPPPTVRRHRAAVESQTTLRHFSLGGNESTRNLVNRPPTADIEMQPLGGVVIPALTKRREVYSAEVARERRMLSWVLFAVAVVLSPALLLFALGKFDKVVQVVTSGRVRSVEERPRAWARWLCVPVPVVELVLLVALVVVGNGRG